MATLVSDQYSPIINQQFDLDEVLTLAEEYCSTQHHDHDHDHITAVQDDHDHDHDDQLALAAPNSDANYYRVPEVTTPFQLNAGVDSKFCTVCMETLQQPGERIPCGHLYHASCIAAWLSVCNSCPLCRRPISAAEQFSFSGKH